MECILHSVERGNRTSCQSVAKHRTPDAGISSRMLSRGEVTDWSRHRGRMRCVVAIPARDEARWLPSCLAALASQRNIPAGPLPDLSFAVVLYANNCVDATVAQARALESAFPFRFRIVEATLLAVFCGRRRLRQKQAVK